MGDIPQFHLFIRKLWQPIVFSPNLTPKRPRGVGTLPNLCLVSWVLIPWLRSGLIWGQWGPVPWENLLADGFILFNHVEIVIHYNPPKTHNVPFGDVLEPSTSWAFLKEKPHFNKTPSWSFMDWDPHTEDVGVFYEGVGSCLWHWLAVAEKRACTRSAWMGQWNRRPRRKLQYSPLVENFLRARKYSSVNLVRATRHLGSSADTALVAPHLVPRVDR